MVIKNGSIVVISGPSGVGKDTVVNLITSQVDFLRLPTCTTRLKRQGEVDGIHYHFLREEEFFALKQENRLLDHVIISGHHYGLLLEHVFDVTGKGKNILVSLVVGSALLLKSIIPEAILIFVMPPSYEEIVKRLQKRGMSNKDIKIRLKDDPTPLELVRYFDFVVVNHEGEEQETVSKILNFAHSAQEKNKNIGLTVSTKGSIVKYMYPKFFATKNLNKLQEVNEILGKDLQQIDVELFEPQGLDVVEVVKDKARDAFHKTGKFVLVEDTGLEFTAWNGMPGALIKWFIQSIGNEGVLKMLQGETNRQAVAKTAVGFYDGKDCHVFVGEVQGIIPNEIRGKGGFGWDPIFIPENHSKSFAEMTSEEKNSVSMRKLALLRLKEFFDKTRNV